MKIIIFYLCIVNLLAFGIYGLDKLKAKIKRKRPCRRIPEKVLLSFAVIGGSVGAYLGMRFFHHKTKKPKFYIGVPLIFLFQLVAALCLWLFL